MEIRERVGAKSMLIGNYNLLGVIWLSQGAGEKAVGAFQRALDLEREVGKSSSWSLFRWEWPLWLEGKTMRRCGDGRRRSPWGPGSASRTLAALEEAHQGGDEFRAFCVRYRDAHPEQEGRHTFFSGFRSWPPHAGSPDARSAMILPRLWPPVGPGTTRSATAPSARGKD